MKIWRRSRKGRKAERGRSSRGVGACDAQRALLKMATDRDLPFQRLEKASPAQSNPKLLWGGLDASLSKYIAASNATREPICDG